MPVCGATTVISKDPADLKKTSLVKGTTPTDSLSVLGAKSRSSYLNAHHFFDFFKISKSERDTPSAFCRDLTRAYVVRVGLTPQTTYWSFEL